MAGDGFKLPGPRSLTRADLDQTPADGRRYEILDGLLVVVPVPDLAHQRTLGNLMLALKSTCPNELLVLPGPIGLALSDDTELQPDLLIVRRDDVAADDMPIEGELVIEILSPSTRAYDLLLKKDRLQRAGCQHYWVVDSEVPAVTAWTLHGGSYVEVATVTGDHQFSVTEPFEISLTPSRLISD